MYDLRKNGNSVGERGNGISRDPVAICVPICETRRISRVTRVQCVGGSSDRDSVCACTRRDSGVQAAWAPIGGVPFTLRHIARAVHASRNAGTRFTRECVYHMCATAASLKFAE